MNNDKNEIEKLKKQFDSIEVPIRLRSAIEESVREAKKDMKKRNSRIIWSRNIGISAAAVMLAFTIGINTMPAFAEGLKDIPGIGTLVKVLQFHDSKAAGGKITDGSDVKKIGMENNKDTQEIVIDFEQNEKAQDNVGSFDVKYTEYPSTMTFTMSGVRKLSAEKYFEALKNTGFIKDVYKIITLDDSMVRFAVNFNVPVKCEVKEYKNPAKVVVSLSQDPAAKTSPVFSIRTNSIPSGEDLGITEEILMQEKNVRILKDQKGSFLVEAAYFENEQDAQTKFKELKEKYSDVYMVIEKRNPGDIPAALVKEASNEGFLAVINYGDKTLEGVFKIDDKSLSFYETDSQKPTFIFDLNNTSFTKSSGEASFILSVKTEKESLRFSGLYEDFFNEISKYIKTK